MSLRLTLPGADDLTFNEPGSGLNAQTFDLGFPQVRANVSNRSGRDGSQDRTRYVGSRVVTIGCILHDGDLGTRGQVKDRLASFCHPGLRPILLFDPEGRRGALTRRVQLRADTLSAPLLNSVTQVWQVTFVGDLIESASAATATIEPAEDPDGFTFDLDFDLTFPATDITLGTTVVNDGSMGAWPTVTITGPCTGPAITNATTGQTLTFPDLELGADDELVIDFSAGTVLLNGTADRYSYMDFTASEWWQLPPGPSEIQFTADLLESPAHATLTWRHTYLT